MYPLDVVKTRTQLSTDKSIGVFQTLKNIVNNEGFLTLYRGIISPIFAEAPKRALKFASNEVYKPIFKNKEGKLTWLGSGGAGAMAGITETFVNCPFEVVKVRLQSKENKALYNGVMDAVVKIAKNEGILALYKGFEPQLIRNAVWNGAYFAMIPTIKKLLKEEQAKDKYEKWTKGFISGAVGGSIATTFNTPFDVVKSRMQNQKGTDIKYTSTFPSLFKIYSEEGITALYKGYAARLYRLGPGGGIMIVAFDVVKELFDKHEKK